MTVLIPMITTVWWAIATVASVREYRRAVPPC